ncbi:uncharacterized protein LOC127837693 [Dreissena polymorpha]|uniref:uncharacterized protein LOC127837693 n=1 Tax=Dreissena polymorpha TaxID=45954 RepID=UPI0022646FFC|nr:uncharacterized protein LOC127837693 [Dreissena polymorpha]
MEVTMNPKSMLKWVWLTVCFRQVSNIDIAVGYVQMAENSIAVPIECTSNDGISFLYIKREGATGTLKTIAERDAQLGSCYLLDTTANEQNYAAAYTSVGCILFIKNLTDETYGTYICCELYSPSICVNTTIIPNPNINDNSVKDFVKANLSNLHEYEMNPSYTGDLIFVSIVSFCFGAFGAWLGYRWYLYHRKKCCCKNRQKVDEDNFFLVLRRQELNI